jgi:hypothetical protein
MCPYLAKEGREIGRKEAKHKGGVEGRKEGKTGKVRRNDGNKGIKE